MFRGTPCTTHELKLHISVIKYYFRLKSFFNWTMSYRIDSDIYLPYGYVSEKESPSVLAPYPPKWPDSSVVRSIPVLPTKWRQHPDNRKLVSWVVSNCKTHSKREEYVEVKNDKKNMFDLFVTSWRTQRCPVYS